MFDQLAFDEYWPTRPDDGIQATQLVDALVRCSVDDLFNLMFAPNSVFVVEANSSRKHKEYCESGWHNSPALLPGSPKGVDWDVEELETVDLQKGALRKLKFRQASGISSTNVEVLQRILSYNVEQNFEVEEVVAVDLWVAQTIRTICKYSIKQVSPGWSRLQVNFNVVNTIPGREVILIAKQGIQSGLLSNFSHYMKALNSHYMTVEVGQSDSSIDEYEQEDILIQNDEDIILKNQTKEELQSAQQQQKQKQEIIQQQLLFQEGGQQISEGRFPFGGKFGQGWWTTYVDDAFIESMLPYARYGENLFKFVCSILYQLIFPLLLCTLITLRPRFIVYSKSENPALNLFAKLAWLLPSDLYYTLYDILFLSFFWQFIRVILVINQGFGDDNQPRHNVPFLGYLYFVQQQFVVNWRQWEQVRLKKSAKSPLEKMLIKNLSQNRRIIHGSRMGSFDFEPSHSFSLFREVEIFENQRWQLWGWGSSFPGHMLPADPRQYSDRNGKIVFDGLFEETEAGWKWQDRSWELDLSGKLLNQVDIDGWFYGVDFKGEFMQWPPREGMGIQGPFTFVRRRRRIRRKVHDENYQHEPPSPLIVADADVSQLDSPSENNSEAKSDPTLDQATSSTPKQNKSLLKMKSLSENVLNAFQNTSEKLKQRSRKYSQEKREIE